MIGIIIFVIFTILLAQAIFETIYGTCLLIYGLGCHAIAYSLEFIVFIGRLFSKTKPKRKAVNVAHAIQNRYDNTK